ncbi:MAG: PilZ domain-containing protein [Bryobacteraceae bacterium]
MTATMEPRLPLIRGDRRKHRRYGLTLELRYKSLKGRRVIEMGYGTTCDLSVGGLAFFSDQALPQGAAVEIWMDWPVLLHDQHPLQLVVFGRVVRSTSAITAIRMTRHEFRTAGTQHFRQCQTWELTAHADM